MKKRIREHRRDPIRAPLYPGFCLRDPVLRRLYRAVEWRERGNEKDWWASWLIRAGMSPEEAATASRYDRKVRLSREDVLRELKELYKKAVHEGTWPTREPKLRHGLRRHAQQAYGSQRAARKAAIQALGLRRQKRLTGEESTLVRVLSGHIEGLLPQDAGGARPKRMSLSGVAAELGIRHWRAKHRIRSLERLMTRAIEAGRETVARLVRYVVKRAVRDRRLKGIWGRLDRFRVNDEPIWREEVEEIAGILAGAGIVIAELEDPRFLRGLPRRSLRGLTGSLMGLPPHDPVARLFRDVAPGVEQGKIERVNRRRKSNTGAANKDAGGSGRLGAYSLAPTPVAPPPASN